MRGGEGRRKGGKGIQSGKFEKSDRDEHVNALTKEISNKT